MTCTATVRTGSPSAARQPAGSANVLLENSTLNGFDSFGNLSASDTGIQIKTDANSGGLTQQVTYRDICMTNIKHVLIFNPHYSSGGTSVPTQSDIVLNGVVSTDSESGAYSIFEGYDAQNPLQLELENIDLDNVTQDGNHGNEGPTREKARRNTWRPTSTTATSSRLARSATAPTT